MNLSVLKWNLHQQGGKGHVPPFVSEEIHIFDMACLTEFCTGARGGGRLSRTWNGGDTPAAGPTTRTGAWMSWESC